MGYRAGGCGTRFDDGARNGPGWDGGNVRHRQGIATRGASRHRRPRHPGAYCGHYDGAYIPGCETGEAGLERVGGGGLIFALKPFGVVFFGVSNIVVEFAPLKFFHDRQPRFARR